MNSLIRSFGLLPLALLAAATSFAHDTWVEVNTPLIRQAEPVYADLCLGNHSNNQRDFLLSGRVNLDWVSWYVSAPDGTQVDLREQASATSAEEKQGYWTAKVIPNQEGVYTVVQSLDRVMQHGKSVRGVRTAKTFFVVSDSLDEIQIQSQRHTTGCGLPFEIVMQTCAFGELSAGQPVRLQVLKGGKPASGVQVTMIPRGTLPPETADPTFDQQTDAQGNVTFTPDEAGVFMFVAHHTAEDENNSDYEYTSYGATLTTHVPSRPYAEGT